MKSGTEQLGRLKLHAKFLTTVEVGRKKEAAILELFYLAEIVQY